MFFTARLPDLKNLTQILGRSTGRSLTLSLEPEIYITVSEDSKVFGKRVLTRDAFACSIPRFLLIRRDLFVEVLSLAVKKFEDSRESAENERILSSE